MALLRFNFKHDMLERKYNRANHMSWKLQALSDELNGQEIKIDHSMIVGRQQDCDVVLQSSAVSRKHAAFTVQDGGLWLKDLGSSNGTFVNDLRIDHDTLLKDEDIVQFANLKFLTLAPASEEKCTEQEPVLETETAPSMQEQGMPSIAERVDTSINPDGMPQKIAIPIPAPIPEGVNIKAAAEPAPVAIEPEPSRVEQKIEEKKNTSVGLITIIMLIILAVIAWVFLK